MTRVVVAFVGVLGIKSELHTLRGRGFEPLAGWIRTMHMENMVDLVYEMRYTQF